MMPTAHDPTSAVFDEAADTLDEAAAGARSEAGRIRHLRRERDKKRAWREVLGPGVARNLLEDLAVTAGQMSSVAGGLRRAIVHALLAEGQRVKQIAESLGVSHQRISCVAGQNATTSRATPEVMGDVPGRVGATPGATERMNRPGGANA